MHTLIRSYAQTNGERIGDYHHKFEGGKVVAAVVMPPEACQELQGEHNTTQHNRTEQNRTEQNRTEQNRTKQNKTELDMCEDSLHIDRVFIGTEKSGTNAGGEAARPVVSEMNGPATVREPALTGRGGVTVPWAVDKGLAASSWREGNWPRVPSKSC